MKRLSSLSRLCLILVTSVAVGCAAKPERTGFLSDYEKLEPVKGEETFLRYVAPDEELSKYSGMMLDPAAVYFHAKSDSKKVKPEDVERLSKLLDDQLRKDFLEAKFNVVDRPGEGVARLRVAITDLRPGTPALNVLPQTKLTGVGLGQAAGEFELVDSLTGKQLAAAIKAETGSRFSLSGLSEWGDVEAVMKEWSKAIVKRLSAARDKMNTAH